VETTILNVLVLTAFGLLVAVSGGIVYLTVAEWRDRRRQDREKRSAKRR
jgi:biopolymer transport protein ExbB/TolQ